jgi:uncharacterized protein (TIGR03435 family)
LKILPQIPLSGHRSRRSFDFAALEEQLGIKLESQKGENTVLVIDHVEHPSED